MFHMRLITTFVIGLRVNLILVWTQLEVGDCFPTIGVDCSLVISPVFKSLFRKRETGVVSNKTNEVLLNVSGKTSYDH